MPPTAQLEVQDISLPATSLVSDDWQGFLRALDPLAEWKKSFAEWRQGITEFRDSEHEFFSHLQDEDWQRVHRGWLCSLISSGEMLAVTLSRSKQQKNAPKEFELLGLCLENLRSTFDTWHTLLEIEKPSKA